MLLIIIGDKSHKLLVMVCKSLYAQIYHENMICFLMKNKEF